MKQMKPETREPMNAASTQAKEIAREFSRISKLTESGKGDEAWRVANELYGKYPKEATPNFVMALILSGKEKWARALPYAEAAEKLAPDNAAYKVFLGKLYVELDMIEFASDLLRRALAMDKTLFQAPLAMANYYLESGQGSRALPYYDLALQAAPPAYKGTAHFYRAECLRAMGRLAESEVEYKHVVDMPQHRVSTLTSMAVLKKNDHESEYAKQIRKELERPDLTDDDRSVLLLCLGHLHENGRDYDNAFQNFTQSRRLLPIGSKIDDFIAQINDIVGNITPEVFDRFREFGHKSDKPIFVVGMPRSGTTLTEQIIGAHSLAQGVGELRRISRMAAFFMRRGGIRQLLDEMGKVGPDQWKEVPRQYLTLLREVAPEGRYTVDKMPHNFIHLGFIHLCFPNAKIIHCKRNPLDNFISAFQGQMNAHHSYSYDQEYYGEYYVQYLRLMDHFKSVMPDSIYESQYEALTENPEIEIRNLLNYLGLPWEERCLKHNERQSTVNTLSYSQVRNPINTGSVGRWRNYETHLAPIIAVFEKAGVQI